MDEDLHSNHVNARNPLYHNPARAMDNDGGGVGAVVEEGFTARKRERERANRFAAIDNFRPVDRKTKRVVLRVTSFSSQELSLRPLFARINLPYPYRNRRASSSLLPCLCPTSTVFIVFRRCDVYTLFVEPREIYKLKKNRKNWATIRSFAGVRATFDEKRVCSTNLACNTQRVLIPGPRLYSKRVIDSRSCKIKQRK